MNSTVFSLALLVSILQFSGCDIFPTPKEKLPPITHEDKNTFGCLVNGKVWLPNGNDGTSNLDLSYDSSFIGGRLTFPHIATMEIIIKTGRT
jgi:hypothetical protein